MNARSEQNVIAAPVHDSLHPQHLHLTTAKTTALVPFTNLHREANRKQHRATASQRGGDAHQQLQLHTPGLAPHLHYIRQHRSAPPPPSSHGTTSANVHLCTSGTQIHPVATMYHLCSESNNATTTPSLSSSHHLCTRSKQRPPLMEICDIILTHHAPHT